MQLLQTERQRNGPRLQDIGRFDLVELSVPDRRDSLETRPLADSLGAEFLAAPGSDDQSGERRMTQSGPDRMRCLASGRLARSAKISSPPAMSISSETQPMPQIIGSSHSSK